MYIYGKCLTTERLNLPFNPAREVDIFTQNNTLKCGWKHIQSTFFIQQQNFLSILQNFISAHLLSIKIGLSSLYLCNRGIHTAKQECKSMLQPLGMNACKSFSILCLLLFFSCISEWACAHRRVREFHSLLSKEPVQDY